MLATTCWYWQNIHIPHEEQICHLALSKAPVLECFPLWSKLCVSLISITNFNISRIIGLWGSIPSHKSPPASCRQAVRQGRQYGRPFLLLSLAPSACFNIPQCPSCYNAEGLRFSWQWKGKLSSEARGTVLIHIYKTNVASHPTRL